MDFRSGSDREGGGALGEYIKKIKDRSKRRRREKKGSLPPPHHVVWRPHKGVE
jgi:hypothetical protein